MKIKKKNAKSHLTDIYRRWKKICHWLLGVNHGSQRERPAACLYPAVIVCFRRTAGFFPQEADHVFRLSVSRGRGQRSAVFTLGVCAGLWEHSAETSGFFFFKLKYLMSLSVILIQITHKCQNLHFNSFVITVRRTDFLCWISLQFLSYWSEIGHQHEDTLLFQLPHCLYFCTVQVREKRRAVSSHLRSTVSRGAADLWWPRLLWHAATWRG